MTLRCRHRRNNVDPETIALAQRFQNLHVTRALFAKTMVVSDEQLAHPETAAQDELYEFLGGIGSELGGKWQDRQVVDSRLRQHFLLLIVRRQHQWCRHG